MYETTVTVQGWLGNDVTTRAVGDAQVASFRVATTPRRYQRQTETWVDGTTQWYAVTAWPPSPTTAGSRCGGATRSWCRVG